MVRLSRLRCHPRHFRSFTGLSVVEFDQLLAELTPLYESSLSETKSRPDRRRALGAGRPFSLALPERLLMCLMYLRLYVSQGLLSFLFDLDQSNVSREINERLLPVLLRVLPVPLRDAPLRAESPAPEEPEMPGKPSGKTAEKPARKPRKRRINTLEELLRLHPEIQEVLIDATEQTIPQPEEKMRRKRAYSGKQHDHTIKTQIVATKETILHVFGGLPGCLHDQVLLGASGVMHQIPEAVTTRVDKGYAGTDTRYPKATVAIPIKKRLGHQITWLGRAYNHLLSVLRMPVEHHFARLQTFGVLAQQFRGRKGPAAHEDIFCVVSGLFNFRATGRFTLA